MQWRLLVNIKAQLIQYIKVKRQFQHLKCQNLAFVLLILAFKTPKRGVLSAKKGEF